MDPNVHPESDHLMIGHLPIERVIERSGTLVERPSEKQMMNIAAHPMFTGRSYGTAALGITSTCH
jgi:hypothetical protein